MRVLTKQLVFVLGREYQSGRTYTAEKKKALLYSLNSKIPFIVYFRLDRSDLCGNLSMFDGELTMCARMGNFTFEGDLLFADVLPYGPMDYAATSSSSYVINWLVDEETFAGSRCVEIKGVYGAYCTPLRVHPLIDTPKMVEHI